MTRLAASKVKGFVHDVGMLSGLGTESCHLLLVSDRTLYVLNNFASEDIEYRTRWGKNFSAGLFDTIDFDGPDGDLVYQTIDIVRRDLMTQCAGLTEIVDAINGLIPHLGGCGGCGTELDEGANDGQTLPIGEGEKYPDLESYNVAKCKAANLILDQVYDSVLRLLIFDVDSLGAGGVALAVTLVTTLVAAGPAGWAVGAIVGVATGIVSLLLSQTTFDLQDLKDIFDAHRQTLTCALYDSTSSDDARTNLLAELGIRGATVLERDLVDLLISTKLMNQLFSPDDRVDTYPATTSCSSCVSELLDWTISPNGAWGIGTVSSPFMGVGTPVSDGTQFEIQAVQTNSGYTGWVISLHVEVYDDDFASFPFFNTLAESYSGVIELHTAAPSGGGTLQRGRQVILPASCGVEMPRVDPSPGVGQKADFQNVVFGGPNPFSITFSVPTKPSAC